MHVAKGASSVSAASVLITAIAMPGVIMLSVKLTLRIVSIVDKTCVRCATKSVPSVNGTIVPNMPPLVPSAASNTARPV